MRNVFKMQKVQSDFDCISDKTNISDDQSECIFAEVLLK